MPSFILNLKRGGKEKLTYNTKSLHQRVKKTIKKRLIF